MAENAVEKVRNITEQINQTRKMLLEEYLGHSISMEEAINMEMPDEVLEHLGDL
ncbi:hypothetical protein ACMSDQ_18185 [Bacteroides thetaiotaomicron]|jgi:hypothetical protein|uniref:hypothetical protein n=1 Tax=Bacteroides TaxID=816 RepID=UPI001C2BC07A|nr:MULTISPECIES: hypothetical protein [Bacteroides]MBU9879660.1 hypothetical protein [Bacteroides sp. MSK.20.82]MCE9205877.1 hypothetical protein [Bacteroides thetaiotaomicron]